MRLKPVSKGISVLLELHANPGNLSPADYATAVAKAEAREPSWSRTNTVDNLSVYLEALSTAGIRATATIARIRERRRYFYPLRWS